jgi:hypothetical protein
VLLQWEPVPDAGSYDVAITQLSAFDVQSSSLQASAPITHTVGAEQTTFTVTAPSDGVYEWIVRATVNNEAQAWSPPSTFQVGELAQPNGIYLPLLALHEDCHGLLTKEKVWSGTLAVSCDESTLLAGQASLKLHASTPSIVELYSPLIPVTPNTLYEMSYQVRTDLTVDGADMYGKVIAAQYFSTTSEGDAVDQNRIDPGFNLGTSMGGQTDWQSKSYTFTTSANTAFVRLRATMGGPVGTATGTMWVSAVNIQVKAE